MVSAGSAPQVFISSAWKGLADVREQIASRLAEAGFRPFLFEKFRSQNDWKLFTPAENENTCLEEIDRSDFVVCVFDAQYGSSARDHIAGIALTDLEMFQALRSGKPIRIYVLENPKRSPELVALLEIAGTALPGMVVNLSTKRAIGDRVVADLEEHFRRSKRTRPLSECKRFSMFCERTIQQRFSLDDQLTGLRFLRDQFPTHSGVFDAENVADDLAMAQQLRPHDVRLAALWSVLQSLFAVPWYAADRRWLDLWDRCLSAWNKSAAWYGQHGLQYAGALAADNTLVAIRALLAGTGEAMTLAEILKRGERIAGAPAGWIRLYETAGALGSEYFSISGLSPWRLRKHYLWKADTWCAVGERVDAIEAKAGLDPNLAGRAARASIRGQVRMALGDRSTGIRLLEESLRCRIEAKLNPDSIGWAQVALGHALYLNGNKRQAETNLDAGLAAVERTGSPGFIVRAKKRVAQIRVRQLRLRDAGAQLEQAWEIARTNHLMGQMAELERLVPRSLRLLARAR
jgi:hypothetical protein